MQELFKIKKRREEDNGFYEFANGQSGLEERHEFVCVLSWVSSCGGQAIHREPQFHAFVVILLHLRFEQAHKLAAVALGRGASEQTVCLLVK